MNKTITISEGLDVTKFMRIRKYDLDELKASNVILQKKKTKFTKYMFRYKWFKKLYFYLYFKITGKIKGSSYPEDISKSDETNIQNIFDKLKSKYPNELYYLTEKMEGQSATYEYRNCVKKWYSFNVKNTFKVYSHNIQKNIDDNSNWWKIAKNEQIEEKMSKVPYNVAVQGEIVGKGIQKDIYQFGGLRFFVFRVKNLSTGKYLEYKELKKFCKEYEFEMVPVIDENKKLLSNIKEILEDSNGITIFNKVNKNQLKEGIVWRSQSNQNVGFKAKSPKYLQWWDKK
jgi:RNA ligase (TIGR02306 family)